MAGHPYEGFWRALIRSRAKHVENPRVGPMGSRRLRSRAVHAFYNKEAVNAKGRHWQGAEGSLKKRPRLRSSRVSDPCWRPPPRHSDDLTKAANHDEGPAQPTEVSALRVNTRAVGVNHAGEGLSTLRRGDHPFKGLVAGGGGGG